MGCKSAEREGGLTEHLWLSRPCLWAALANSLLSLAGWIIPSVQAPCASLVSLLLLAINHLCPTRVPPMPGGGKKKCLVAVWFVIQNTPGRQLEASQENRVIPR